MNQRFEHELSETLAAAVREHDAVPAAMVERAQARLDQRLREAVRPRRPGMPRWVGASALAALAMVALMAGPMLSGGGDAFAAMQERLRHFTSLDMQVTQRVQGRVIQTSRTVVDARGVVRTDVGDELSVIVDPVRARSLTLLHGAKQAMRVALPASGATPAASLRWLDELRNFKGEARRLPGTRTIEGRTALGWSLRANGVDMEVWTDADGLPLALRQQGGAGLEIDYRFTLDRPIAPGRLSTDPPPGYALVDPDRD